MSTCTLSFGDSSWSDEKFVGDEKRGTFGDMIFLHESYYQQDLCVSPGVRTVACDAPLGLVGTFTTS